MLLKEIEKDAFVIIATVLDTSIRCLRLARYHLQQFIRLTADGLAERWGTALLDQNLSAADLADGGYI